MRRLTPRSKLCTRLFLFFFKETKEFVHNIRNNCLQNISFRHVQKFKKKLSETSGVKVYCKKQDVLLEFTQVGLRTSILKRLLKALVGFLQISFPLNTMTLTKLKHIPGFTLNTIFTGKQSKRCSFQGVVKLLVI